MIAELFYMREPALDPKGKPRNGIHIYDAATGKKVQTLHDAEAAARIISADHRRPTGAS